VQDSTNSSSESYSQTVVWTASESAASLAPTPKTLNPWQTAVMVVSLLLLGIGGTFAGIRVANGLSQANDTAHILPGVKIADIPVGGMTSEEATEKIRPLAREKMQQPITFAAPVTGREWNPTLAAIGGRFEVNEAVQKALAVGRKDSLWFHLINGGKERDVNIAVPFKLNQDQLDKQLAKIANDVYKAPKNAQAKVTANGTIALAAPEQKGVKLDIEATKAALLKGGVESLQDGAQTDLVVAEELPQITTASIKEMRYKLGGFSTYYGSSSYNRKSNISKATQSINGVLLAPGDVFSYNKTVGRRIRSLGWKDAPTYQDGQVVPGIGGGICQVSTTLYNAALSANLKIVSRTGHSMPVHYVPAGRDATVVDGAIDFQFANSTQGPVLVIGQADGGTLRFTLWGTQQGERVEIVSGGRSYNKRGGINVSTYRVITQADGTKRREYLGTSSYRPHAPKSSTTTRRRTSTATNKPRITPAPAKPNRPASSPSSEDV